MIKNDTLVHVNEQYSGGLEGVTGRDAHVVGYDAQSDTYLLDIKGYKSFSYGATSFYKVVARENELDVVDVDFKNVDGQQIHLGDTVAVAVVGGAIRRGVVKKFKRGGWNDNIIKVQLEVDEVWSHTVNNRPYYEKGKTYRWYENGGRMITILSPHDIYDNLVIGPATIYGTLDDNN